MRTLRSFALLALVLLASCESPTSPAAIAPPAASAPLVVRFSLTCPTSTLWDFVVDGRSVNRRGDVWLVPDTATFVVVVSDSIKQHRFEATRWSPGPFVVVSDAIVTGATYPLPCQ